MFPNPNVTLQTVLKEEPVAARWERRIGLFLRIKNNKNQQKVIVFISSMLIYGEWLGQQKKCLVRAAASQSGKD